MGVLSAILPGILEALFKAVLNQIFGGETVWTVSETDGIQGADVAGGSKPALSPDDLPAF